MRLNRKMTLSQYQDLFCNDRTYREYCAKIFENLDNDYKKKDAIQKNTMHFCIALFLGGASSKENGSLYLNDIACQTYSAWIASCARCLHNNSASFGEENKKIIEFAKNPNVTIQDAIDWVKIGKLYQNIEQSAIDKIEKMTDILLEKKQFGNICYGGTYNEILELLEQNKQLILHGAPGTGKTFSARNEIAEKLFGIQEYGYIEKEWEKSIRMEMVQFHPSYDYTDFIEGIRPNLQSSTLTYTLQNGSFKAFCRRAGVLERIISARKKITDENIEYFLENEPEAQEYWKNIICFGSIQKSIYEWNTFLEHYQYNNSYRDSIEKKITNAYENKKCINEQMINVYEDKKYMNEPMINIYENSKFIDKDKRILCENKQLEIIEKIKKQLPPFLFIIDEINRAEISKVFGEVMVCLDMDYRGDNGKISTQYATSATNKSFYISERNDKFYIPSNVYIIGTMNDIDRSVELFDFALRRRFVWYEMKVEDVMEDMLESMELPNVLGQQYEVYLEKINNLNEAIHTELKLSRQYDLGPAYFAKIKLYYKGNLQKALEKVWKNHILQILTEYIKGRNYLEEKIIEMGENWKSVY